MRLDWKRDGRKRRYTASREPGSATYAAMYVKAKGQRPGYWIWRCENSAGAVIHTDSEKHMTHGDAQAAAERGAAL